MSRTVHVIALKQGAFNGSAQERLIKSVLTYIMPALNADMRQYTLSMKYLVKYSPEMTIKSRPVRNRFAKQLRKNLKVQLRRLSDSIEVSGGWDFVEVDVPDAFLEAGSVTSSDVINNTGSDKRLSQLGRIEQVLGTTPGICFFDRVRQHTFATLDDVTHHTLTVFQDKLAGKSFCVRCKRTGKHDFNSMDVEKFVGSGLNLNTQATGVSLNHPQVLVKLEIRNQDLYVVEASFPGLNGFPLGTQDGVLSLISGGFDSSVSSYLSMRRGLLTHYCFFNLGGREHEIAVKEVALYLWMRYGSTHPVKFVTVPFENVVAEILDKVDNSQMGVILKRMMLRAASRVAEKLKLEALVTGESVAQVSSQTLANLAIIDKVTDTLVLRPLAMMEKQDIVDTARVIGTEVFSAVIPEYCGVISIKPTTRARMHKIDHQESRFDFSVLETAIDSAEPVIIDRMNLESSQASQDVMLVSEPEPGAIIIDIRHPEEEEQQPLLLDNHVVEKIPFYKLNTVFAGLSGESEYLLYCGKGIMSRLHAGYLVEQGYGNVGVYRPEI